jgi:hypothetical protein
MTLNEIGGVDTNGQGTADTVALASNGQNINALVGGILHTNGNPVAEGFTTTGNAWVRDSGTSVQFAYTGITTSSFTGVTSAGSLVLTGSATPSAADPITQATPAMLLIQNYAPSLLQLTDSQLGRTDAVWELGAGGSAPDLPMSRIVFNQSVAGLEGSDYSNGIATCPNGTHSVTVTTTNFGAPGVIDIAPQWNAGAWYVGPAAAGTPKFTVTFQTAPTGDQLFSWEARMVTPS